MVNWDRLGYKPWSDFGPLGRNRALPSCHSSLYQQRDEEPSSLERGGRAQKGERERERRRNRKENTTDESVLQSIITERGRVCCERYCYFTERHDRKQTPHKPEELRGSAKGPVKKNAFGREYSSSHETFPLRLIRELMAFLLITNLWCCIYQQWLTALSWAETTASFL